MSRQKSKAVGELVDGTKRLSDQITPAEERWVSETWRKLPALEQLAFRLILYRILESDGKPVDKREVRKIVFDLHAESLRVLLEDEKS